MDELLLLAWRLLNDRLEAAGLLADDSLLYDLPLGIDNVLDNLAGGRAGLTSLDDVALNHLDGAGLLALYHQTPAGQYLALSSRSQNLSLGPGRHDLSL